MIRANVEGVKGVSAMIKMIESRVIKSQRKINKARAQNFRKETIKYVKNSELGLYPIKDTTIAKRIQNIGGPMYDTGELVQGQEVISRKNGSAECGYFREKTKTHSRTRLTNFILAIIHHAGATLRNGGILRPRPFMFLSANKYKTTNDDLNIAAKMTVEAIEGKYVL